VGRQALSAAEVDEVWRRWRSGQAVTLIDPMPGPNGDAGSRTGRRQQAMIEQLTLRIR
jgi:hypothetical protein